MEEKRSYKFRGNGEEADIIQFNPLCTRCGESKTREDFSAGMAQVGFVKVWRYGRVCKRCKRIESISNTYKIDTEKIFLLLKSQEYKCGICGKEGSPFNEEVKLVVDHDHNTQLVRGFLCVRCNTSLGQFSDSVEGLKKAINYLENPPYNKLF